MKTLNIQIIAIINVKELYNNYKNRLKRSETYTETERGSTNIK